ncbi:MAG: FmdE family protein [Promethearchaeota archaeon]
MDVNELMKKATIFHGHICPGVALGVLVAKYALENGFEHSPDEELVAIVENNNCSIDALQAILSTTYGKGNLVHRDYGKNNFTLFSRKAKKGVKLSLKSISFDTKKVNRDERVKLLLESNLEEIFDIKEVEYKPPPKTQIEESIPCDICKELTMSSRMVDYQENKMCIPCYHNFRK